VFVPGHWNQTKDKLFLFASNEWRYTHSGATVLDTVPTAADRRGDFSSSSLPAPVDPLNDNTPFPGRIVPAMRFSHNGPLLLTPIPLPNFSGPGGNYSVTGVNQTDPHDLILRSD
jgi:hypothetical protein